MDTRVNNNKFKIGKINYNDENIIMKIMKKMGYKGGGLGKNQHGIISPIEATKRLNNAGLGFHNYRDNTNTTQVVVEEEDDDDDDVVDIYDHIEATSPRTRVISRDDFMRRSQIRVDEGDKGFNVGLMVDLVGFEVEKIDADLRNEKETVVALGIEKEMLEEKAVEEKMMIDNMEEILKVLDSVDEEFRLGRLSLEYLEECVRELSRRFAVEYNMCELSWLVCFYVVSLLSGVFQGWDPLENPSYGIDVMNVWKCLLEGDGEDVESCPYAQLVNEVVFPSVRVVGINKWQARDPEPMLWFLELWENLLPSSVVQSLLDMIVIPKLTEAIKSWDPCRETVPFHVWIHPWLPLLGRKLESLCQDILVTFENGLRHWHPADMSAYTILFPWKTVFDAASWEQLIARSIYPKLVNVLQELEVNPGNQEIDQFRSVMAWASIVPVRHIVSLLETHFFSKWQLVLYHWLCSNPIFEEVMQWYLGWKELIPAELLANERVRRQLNVGLVMMNRAVEGLDVVQPCMKEDICSLRTRKKRLLDSQMKVGCAAVADGVPHMSLKEVIEAYAQQHGLLFAPKPGRLHNHHQVYSFGSVSITVDSLKQKVFAHVQGQRCLVSLDQLLQMQNTSLLRRH